MLLLLCIHNYLLLINPHQRIIWCFRGCWWSWSAYAHWAASTQSKSSLCASKTRNSHLCFLKFGMSTSEQALRLLDRMSQCQGNMGGQGSSTDRTQGHDVLFHGLKCLPLSREACFYHSLPWLLNFGPSGQWAASFECAIDRLYGQK